VIEGLYAPLLFLNFLFKERVGGSWQVGFSFCKLLLFLLSFLPMRKNLILSFFLQKKGTKSLFSFSFVGQQKKISSGTGKANATIQKVRCGKVNNPVLFQFSF
jgi:hypothetical protein